MPDPSTEITALPGVLPPALLAFVLLLWQLRRRHGALTLPRIAAAAAVGVYVGGVLANTIFPIEVGGPGGTAPWHTFLNLVPGRNTEPFDIVRNVLVFLPLGVLLPLVARVEGVRRVLASGFVVSLLIETLQLVDAGTGHGGHVADVNDLLANTAGAPLGYGLFVLATSVPVVERLAAATTWPPPRRSRPVGAQ